MSLRIQKWLLANWNLSFIVICFQNLTDITHEKLENYFLILSTIEKNLVEAKTIQAEIVKVRRQRKRHFKSEFTLYQTLSLFSTSFN